MSGNPRSVSPDQWPAWLQGSLAPVGEPIALRRKLGGVDWCPSDYRCVLVNSGTAALSLAVSLAAAETGRQGGEVVVPAYGCPDLLAAVHFAGLTPVLADIQADSPRYELDSLEAALSERTVAVVAVNFLGITEDLGRLRRLCAGRGVLLLEDNAQYFPVAAGGDYVADLVVHSFGRGKPISQLGGGAVLARGALATRLVAAAEALSEKSQGPWGWRAQAAAFNLVLHPLVYQGLLKVPGLDIGATRYQPLAGIERLPSWRGEALATAVAAYRARKRSAQRQLDELLGEVGGEMENLPRKLAALDVPLLRYPTLCADSPRRDALYAALTAAGLGASVMYGAPLARIEGIPAALPGDFPGAAAFAGRLLTLPVTSYVGPRHLAKLRNILRAA